MKLASRELASGASHAETHALRDFDLVVMGDETEEAAVISFAKQSGMSAEALAQLFAGPQHSVSADREAAFVAQNLGGGSLFEKLESLGILENLRGNIATVLADSPLVLNKSASVIAEASAQLTQLSAPALERLLQGEESAALLSPIALSVAPETPSTEWIAKFSAEIEPNVGNGSQRVLQDLKALFGMPADSTDTRLSESIATIVAPAAATLISDPALASVLAGFERGSGASSPSEAILAQIEYAISGSLKDLASKSSYSTSGETIPAENDLHMAAEKLAVGLAPLIKSELESVGPLAIEQAASDRGQTAMAVRLAPLLRAWLGQSEVQSEISVLGKGVALEPSALASAIASNVSQSLKPDALPQSNIAGRAIGNVFEAEIGRAQTSVATAAMNPEPQRVSGSAAFTAVQASVVSDAELRLARLAAVAQPAPVQVSISGVAAQAGASLAQVATATLAQVQPSTYVASTQAMVAAESGVAANARLATMDRFAMRGVSVKSNQVATDAKTDPALKTGDAVKSAFEAASALRELVISRSANAPASQQSLPTTSVLLSGEAVDTTSAKLVAQADAGLMRQSISAGADRTMASDVAKPADTSGSGNMLAREAVSRQLSEALGHRLAANIAAGHYRLTLNVHPKELGAIDVVMEMREGRLDAQISSANAVTRDLLGDSLPRLRDALQQNGIQLANLTIGSDAQQSGGRGRGAQADQSDARDTIDQLVVGTSENILEDLDLNLDLDTIDFWA
ncbi:MAG: flagellar hook-length control protein FliK [Proteobacteria bacterium]|nr:flagellar hook-length control protein FliK [Pseudomonadota bacterium]